MTDFMFGESVNNEMLDLIEEFGPAFAIEQLAQALVHRAHAAKAESDTGLAAMNRRAAAGLRRVANKLD